MAAALSSFAVLPRHNPLRPPPSISTETTAAPATTISLAAAAGARNILWTSAAVPAHRRRPLLALAASGGGPRSDDSSSSSTPFEMSMDSALKLLGVSEGASFDDILRAKSAVLASCKGDLEAIAQVEAAYDMLLMQSLSQRRAGKVANSSIRYADVKSASSAGTIGMPQWLQLKKLPVSVETPSTGNLGLQAGVYGALMVSTFVSGTSTSAQWTYTGPDVPGLILATSFGASLYFLSKKNIGLGKATVITMGGLVIGVVIGSAVENWLQVDIVPFLGIHSPAVIISEFILFSQLLVSLYLR